jgi:hypothetical protein
MRGSGLVSLNSATVYGFFTQTETDFRLRLSVDDWDRLGLHEGERVRTVLPGHDPLDLLILGAASLPPFIWLDLQPLAG